jgi:hypothetical protein
MLGLAREYYCCESLRVIEWGREGGNEWVREGGVTHGLIINNNNR